MASSQEAELQSLNSEVEVADEDPTLGGVPSQPKPRPSGFLVRMPWAAVATLAALGLVATLMRGVAMKGASVDAKAPQSIDVLSKELTELVDPFLTGMGETHSDHCASLPHLRFTKVVHNNLGGEGPDTGRKTLEYDAYSFDTGYPHSPAHPGVQLVRVILEAEGPYERPPNTENGLNGQMGKIWLSRNSTVPIHAHVIARDSKHYGQRVTLPESYWSFYGIDMMQPSFNEEVVAKTAEVANGGEGYSLLDPGFITDFIPTDFITNIRNCPKNPPPPDRFHMMPVCEYVGVHGMKQMEHQSVAGLPTQGTTLTKEHLQSTVTFQYRDQADYHFKLAVTGGAAPSPQDQDEPHVMAFSMRPTNFCVRKDACHNVHHMRLNRVTHSNLGGKGPDHGIPTLDYAATWFGDAQTGPAAKQLILRFTAKTPYDRPAGTKNGLQGQIADLYFKPGTSTDLHLDILDAHTGKPIEMAKSDFTFLLDAGEHHPESQEKVCAISDAVRAPPMMSDLKDMGMDMGSNGKCATGEWPAARQDTPHFPRTMTKRDLLHAAEFQLQQKSSFDFNVEVGQGSNPWNVIGLLPRPTTTCHALNPGPFGLMELEL